MACCWVDDGLGDDDARTRTPSTTRRPTLCLAPVRVRACTRTKACRRRRESGACVGGEESRERKEEKAMCVCDGECRRGGG